MDKALVSQHGYVNSKVGLKAKYHGVTVTELSLQEMYGVGGSREMCAVVVVALPFDDISPKNVLSWVMETFPVFCAVQGDPMNLFGVAGVRFFCGEQTISVRCTRFWKQKVQYCAQLVFPLGKNSPFLELSVKKLQNLLDIWAQEPN